MKKHLFITLLAFFAFASFASAQGDLGAFLLKGKVKMVKGETSDIGGYGEIYYNSISFSQAGKVKPDGKPAPFPKYDAKGRLIQVGKSQEHYIAKWIYDAQGRVGKYLYETYCDSYGKRFEYDDKGRIVKVYYFSIGYPQEEELRHTYEYLSADAKGNWTKRKCIDTDGRSTIETRTITYWP